ncbi:MAG: hypothetical protein Q9217_005515, partial [Psora testacea]
LRQPTPRSLPPPYVQERSKQLVEPALKKRKLNEDERASDATATNGSLQCDSKLKGPQAPKNIELQANFDNHNGAARQIRRPPLYPARPNKTSHPAIASKTSNLAYSPLSIKGNVSIKPYMPEAPSCAPRYQHAADFFPWTGDQAEDVLSESTVRNGFYDKPQSSSNEPITARHPLRNSVKHNSGLQILSSLLVSTLKQRQAHGKVATTSTFKPPPRVTLTDTKRESWLRDLSDPSVPLRRLSRTIPHGIRGKILLDQCLNKYIPISRAIWLTKCVGANEIRAFRRKGTGGVFTVGGEMKWIKDWTMNVEQFLGSTISACGGPDWKAHIDYSIHLLSQIYSENLLDREHYLDWLLTSTAESDLESLAIWLLFVAIHLQNLINQRKRGKRLTELLLLHLQKVHEVASEGPYQPMSQDVVKMLQSILVSSPACFILPKCWNEYEHLIEDHVIHNDDALRTAFDNVRLRNLRLQDQLCQSHSYTQLSPEQMILALLDSLAQGPNFGAVARRSLGLSDDHSVIVRTCLQWSSSQDRRGQYRIYAGARLMRLWSRHSVDIQRHILGFLDAKPEAQGLHKPDLYKLLAELTCSNHFSVSRYLQWLMARGSLYDCKSLARDGRCDLRLLLELPLHGLDDHVINLRRSLLSKIRVSVIDEDIGIRELKAKISERLPHLLPQPEAASRTISDLEFANLGQSAKSAAARWLRQALAPQNTDSAAIYPMSEGKTQVHSTVSLHAAHISPDLFRTIVGIFEYLGEFSILADLISSIVSEVHRATLYAMSDAINYHREVFIAIGTAQHFFLCLYNHVHGLEDLKPSDTPLLESLVDLGENLPNVEDEIHHLRKLSLHISANRTTVVCSPISDTVLESVHPMDIILVEELDQMLASGTSLDRQTMSRIFTAVTDQLPHIWTDTSSLAQLASLLSRLQSFDPKVFEPLVVHWLSDLLLSDNRPPLAKILRPMVCLRILSLELIADSAINVLESPSSGSSRGLLALDVLNLITDLDVGPSTESRYPTYRMRDQQELILRTSPSSIIRIFQLAAHLDLSVDECKLCPVQTRLESPLSLSMLQAALLKVANMSMGAMSLDEIAQVSIGKCFLKSEAGDSVGDVTHRFARLLDGVNDFNIQSYQLKLQAALKTRSVDAEGDACVFAGILVKAISTGPADRCTLWARLVSVLTQERATAIRELAEDTLISRISEHTATDNSEKPVWMQGLMGLVEATAFNASTPRPSSVIIRISRALSSLSPLQLTHSINRKISTFPHLHTLLRLLVIHQSVFEQRQIAQDILPHILISLASFLTEHTSIYPSATNRDVFDVLSLLSDYLTEEGRIRCARAFYDKSKAKCRRLSFIFGYPESCESEWLQLVAKSSTFGAPDEKSPKDIAIVRQLYPLRRWEMVPDATPMCAENDTSLSLLFFGTKRSVLDSLDRSSSELPLKATAPDGPSPGRQASADTPNVLPLESSPAVVSVLQSDIGVNTLLARLKQSIASAREFATFLKKRSTLEEEHAQGLKKLCRSSYESARRPENRQGSYAQNYDEVIRIHDCMADNGVQFASSLHQMHEDLHDLVGNMERGRKLWKQNGLTAERRVQDSEALMEKAKAKYNALAEDYDRARTGDRGTGRVFGLKGPKSAAQHEEDLQRKVQQADSDYSSRVQTAKSQRQELINTLRPQAIRALQDLINECDSGLTLSLQKFASYNERLLLGNGLCVSPLQGQQNNQSPRSLRDVVSQIDNTKDLKAYVANFASKVGNAGDIRYERHPTLNSAQPTSSSTNNRSQPQHFQTNPSMPPQHQATPGEATPVAAAAGGAFAAPSMPPDGLNDSPREQNYTLRRESGPPQLPPAQASTPLYTQPPTIPGAVQSNSSNSSLPALRPSFGVSLEDLLKRDGSAIPLVVYQCIQAVDLFGLEVEGIYRLSGSSTHVGRLKAMFDNDPNQLDFRNPEAFYHDVNSVAGLLKQFFRDLPEPLLSREHYQDFIEAARIDDDIMRRDSMHATINALPDPNYATLRALTLHLNRIQEHSAANRMNAGNLAIIFGPTLMGTGPNVADAGWQVRVIDTILQNTYQIFDDD